MDDSHYPRDPEPDDDGERLAELSQLDLEASKGFWTRVRKKIDRRVAAGHVASFTWNLPKLVLIEFLEIAFNIFSPAKGRKGESR